MKKEIVPEIIMTARINARIFHEGCPTMSLIAAAAPVRVFEIEYSARNENPITRVFVAPNITRNSRVFVFEILLPIAAACPLPTPGRNPQTYDEIKEIKTGR